MAIDKVDDFIETKNAGEFTLTKDFGGYKAGQKFILGKYIKGLYYLKAPDSYRTVIYTIYNVDVKNKTFAFGDGEIKL
jgi:hypothetical protein